jgi:hypothetical protein
VKKKLHATIRSVEEKLSEICPQINIILNLKGRHWAIVGGFVRDLIISFYYKVDVPSPDVDIALIGRYPIYRKNDYISAMQENTFGGLKINTSTFGEIDLWTLKGYKNQKFYISKLRNIPKFKRHTDTTIKVKDFNKYIVVWEKYLRDIDFNVNTVLYAYPEKRIIINKEKWFSFLEYKNIEINNADSSYLYLQPIRALALADKLSYLTSQDFRISSQLESGLREYSSEQNRTILDYIEKKIKCRKWRDQVQASYANSLGSTHQE